MLNFCQEWSHSIEIEYKPKGILTRVYFPFPPKVCNYLIDRYKHIHYVTTFLCTEITVTPEFTRQGDCSK